MSKQIKIGFDKVPSPSVPQNLPLYDIDTATPLRDEAGNTIVTNELGTISSYNIEKNSSSIAINNQNSPVNNESLKIVEQFAETSQVSTSLLGVPRTEVQLGLFADVSVYGYDSTTWDYYTFSSPLFYPSEWYRRNHPIYGPRDGVLFKEDVTEQALYLTAFPTQYTFPYGPKFEQSTRNYDPIRFVQYLSFIAIGRILYDYFVVRGYENFANTNFLSPRIEILNSADEPLLDYTITASGAITNSSNFYDVSYGDNLQLAFDEIERFTLIYQDIIGGNFKSPDPSFNLVSNDIYKGILASSETTRPGYTNLSNYFGVLESKQTFRYQPGRISGFTFGVRANTDKTVNSSFIEWGCSNSTDQYMFQIRGSQFNIVRRSTVPLPNDIVVNRLGMTVEDQKLIYPDGLDNSKQLYELVIPRDNFNGDKLDGSGPSGYIINSQNVTMYKIEFGWYGAIGAKFYAYIPVGNNEARWVLLHTLVIENGIGKPCLENPEFKFKYFLRVRDTATLREPMYIFKYGASYYIDGGDEGTSRLNSKFSEPKEYSENTAVIGIIPKEGILNQDGQFIKNQQIAYPYTLNVRTDNPVKLTVKNIIGSPEGHHFCYSPSIHNGISENSKQVELTVNPNRNTVTIQNGTFDPTDDNKKILADGLYNCYLKLRDDSDITGIADIYRLSRSSSDVRYESQLREISEEVVLTNNTIIDPVGNTFNCILTGLNNTLVATENSIKSSKFKIHWLNPVATDPRFNNKHWCDFSISVTDKQPKIVQILNEVTEEFEDKLRFGDNDEEYDIYSNINLTFSHEIEQQTIDSYDIREWDPGYGIRYDLDPRLPSPSGTDSGIISAINGNILFRDHTVIEKRIVDLETRLYFSTPGAAPQISEDEVGNATVGINGSPIDVTIISTLNEEIEIIDNNPVQKYYLLIEGTDTGLISNGTVIQTKSIVLSDNNKLNFVDENGIPRFSYKNISRSRIINFASTELYVVIGMNDYAKINGIVIEEINPTGTSTFTPQWLYTGKSYNSISEEISIFVNSGQSNTIFPPSNFEENNRLSSIKFDTQTLQPLRPGIDIYSFYITPEDDLTVDLQNIFGADRYKITPGSQNNLATFVVANEINTGNSGNIDIGLILKEQ